MFDQSSKAMDEKHSKVITEFEKVRQELSRVGAEKIEYVLKQCWIDLALVGS